jgi:NADH-quinone oxidoreductase subunit J
MPVIPALPIPQIIFYATSLLLILSAGMVIVSRHAVRAALFLVLAFFCSAILWMLVQAEFLSLVLIFIYVGAVMTLFLFVVMMINLDLESLKEGFVRYLPYALIVLFLLALIMCLALSSPISFSHAAYSTHTVSHHSNTRLLGDLLYTHYLYAFELVGFILLVAIIASISLAFHGRQSDAKSQDVAKQLAATKKNRLRMTKMQVEEK